MMGIVFAGSDDEDDSDSGLTQSLSSASDTAEETTQSIADRLESLIAGIGSITAGE